jgi:stearoyl-CoA desaturase (delta-9 desaturase)
MSTPIISIYGIFTTTLTRETLVWSIIYYFITGLGITAGYHRLWSHKAYKATTPLQIILALAGSGAVEGSIQWWCRDHRTHHRYTDTDLDPYGAHKGVFYSHIGWMLFRKDTEKKDIVDMLDLTSNRVVEYQHKLYPFLAIFMGFILPTMVAGLFWGDWWGGFFFAGVARLVMVHHATFCVNSLAHWLGDITYDDKLTPRDHYITALVTLGEGYHNFHHEFPQDYRNALRYYQYDPTKWLIAVLSWVGLAYDLKRFPENEVRKGSYSMKYKKLMTEKKSINWGIDLKTLPTYSMEDVTAEIEKGKKWIILEGEVIDVEHFIDEHPGGRLMLLNYLGKDATKAFNGQVHDHHNAARNLKMQMRVGSVQ